MPDPKRLAATLTQPARRALERAAERALRENHATVEIEHLLLELLRAEDSDLAFLLRHEQLHGPQLQAGLDAAVSRFASSSPRLPTLSTGLLNTLSKAWVIASVEHGQNQVGSATIFCAVGEDPSQRAALLASVPTLGQVFASRLAQNLAEWLKLSSETTAVTPAATKAVGEISALAEYTIDMTAQARAGELDPVVGRDIEIGQIVDVLMRRQQNNPILTGLAGVGKTAIVEGFAQAVAGGRVPPRLADVAVRSLDLGRLQAGASMRGEYEQRLRVVVDEASATTPRTVLFIDEAHMLIGAGGAAGNGDAANLLKPALARGTLAVIAATTWSEYKRFIEKDAALARRFQVIRVDEPTESVAVAMLRATATKLEAHHSIKILEEALSEAVRLSHRFISGRQLPEKAIAVLDTACAHVAIAQNEPSIGIGEAEQRCASLETELARLRRKAATHADRIATLKAVVTDQANAQVQQRRDLLLRARPEDGSFARRDDRGIGAIGSMPVALRRVAPSRWQMVHGLRKRIVERLVATVRLSRRLLRVESRVRRIVVLEASFAHVESEEKTLAVAIADDRRDCDNLENELTDLQRETALQADREERIKTLEHSLMRAREEQRRLSNRAQSDSALATIASVDGGAIAKVVSGWTGIPVGRILSDTLANARALKARMAERIVDQDAALDAICRRIQTFYADLSEPNKPTGVFLLCGPTGVGKTETAITLAELLFGGARSLVTVNMSEYQEAHSVSGLRGAPPGYVGYGSGGTLTEAIRRQPYCVLLLDEIEKAHPDVLEMFYQVFDRGMLEDSEGQVVDFNNTLIFLTSNVGAEILNKVIESDPDASAETLAAAIRPALVQQFSAAFVGRLIVVPYRPLSRRGIEAVTRLQLRRIQERFAATNRGELTYDRRLVKMIAERAGASASGARMVDSILTQSVLPQLSGCILDYAADGRPITGAHLSIGRDGGVVVSLQS